MITISIVHTFHFHDNGTVIKAKTKYCNHCGSYYHILINSCTYNFHNNYSYFMLFICKTTK